MINKIIADHVLHHAFSFVNDIKVKKLKITYNKQFILFEIERYVMKHIQWLNDVLTNIERIDCIIFEKKFQFCCEEFRIVEFICDVEERHSNTTKMIKFWTDLFVKTSLTFANSLNFVSSIESLLLISLLLLSSFMRFWKRMFHSFENSFNKKSWTFLKSLLSIFSFLLLLNMKMTWSYSRWTRVLKIEKKNLMILRNEKKHSIRYESDIWLNAKKNTLSQKKNVVMFSKFWKRFIFIFMTWSLFWKQMFACSSINWIDLIQIFLMRLLLADLFEFDFSILKFVTSSISNILLQTICSKSLRRLMILRKSLKKKTLMIEWTFSPIVCACSLSRLLKKNFLSF
jgi:hypothetical protein